jgi:hypothetical protein
MTFRGISMMKINSHRRFDFPTRHYDERKEQLKAKRESYERMHKRADEGGERTDLLRARISDSWVRDDSYRKSIWQSNLRLLLVFGVLLVVILVFAGLTDLGEFIDKMNNPK